MAAGALVRVAGIARNQHHCPVCKGLHCCRFVGLLLIHNIHFG